ncbi:MAG: sulfatase-like hydrolase/transferase [Deltaproteobacteria bacterium]|nr:sulfatase-like hydrolase/transferase [Deltaproteobacteria bacterium]
MKKITRREFLGLPPKILATAALTGVVGTISACSSDSSSSNSNPSSSNRLLNPNILLLMVDQMQTPPQGYGPNEGMAQGLKEILGFQPLSSDNSYSRFFPGLLRLRQNAVVLRKHHIASSACVPSRACIMTGQYSSITGVDQTDGMLKSASEVTFLDPNGTPTIGDWFRAVGYSTHYFGKWHVSDAEPPDYLEPWGFSEWEKSYPEPHGGNAYNLGVYRDIDFTNNVVNFLAEKGKGGSNTPWFAVGSLVNPHDDGALPVNWQAPGNTGVVPWTNYPPPTSIPIQGQKSLPRTSDGLSVDLNPDGFPQNNSALPPTFSESLNDKPRCQKDYALKYGLMQKSVTEYTFQTMGLNLQSPYPFQLQGQYATGWSLAYNQFYAYCHYLMDLQLRKILQALDNSGLTENTIVIFLSDHGDMTGAHGGMIQKWHNAYEQTIRVPMVVSSPLVNANKSVMREILQPTSSIDLAPTLLALAGFNETPVRGLMENIHGKSVVKAFVGADLSSHIKGKSTGDVIGPDGKARPGVLFMTNDSITEPGANPSGATLAKYNLFLANVNAAISNGSPLAPGTVRQPNHVRALCTGDWKIVRYVDPKAVEPDEWELYYLKADPNEQINLVDFKTGEVRTDVTVSGLAWEELRLKNRQLRNDLAQQEASMHG